MRLTLAAAQIGCSLETQLAMIRFNFLGIPVRIEPWFWITMVFLGGITTATNQQDFIHVGLFVFAGFISIFVHELGHALSIQKFGLQSDITLTTFGGYARIQGGRLDRRQSFLVTAAGPAIQVALGLISLAVIRYLPIPEQSLLLILLFDLVWISIVWALFNCLPIFPMDGGKMLAAIAGERRQRLVHIVGIVCAVGVGFFLFTLLRSWIFPAYMAYFAWINWQGLQEHTAPQSD